MSDYTQTPNYSLYKPTPDADNDVWGDHLNANFDVLDSLIFSIDSRPAGGVTSWNGRAGAVTLQLGDVTALGFATQATSDARYIEAAGDTMLGPLVLAGNASAALQPVPLQQLTSTLGSYAPLASPVFTGAPSLPAGTIAVTQPPGDNDTSPATTAFVTAAIAAAAPPPPVTIADTSAMPPATNGRLWWDSTIGQLMVGYQDPNSTAWIVANSGGIADSPNDGVTYGRKSLGWTQVLPLAGGTLTGPLTLSGNATANLQPVTLQQQTAAIAAAVGNYVAKAGDTMTGGLHFGSAVSSGQGDLSRHIDLYGGTFGWSITANQLNYNVPSGSSHVFWQGGSWLGTLNSSSLNMNVPFYSSGQITGNGTYVTARGGTGQLGAVCTGSGTGIMLMMWNDGNGYISRCDTNGVYNGTTIAQFDTGGGARFNQGVYAAYLYSSGDARVAGNTYFVSSQVSDFQIMVGAPWRYFQYAGNWYWAWNGNNGTLLWNGGGNGNVFQIDGGGTTTQSGGNYNTYLHTNGAGWMNGELAVYRVGVWDMGVAYTAWASNHIGWGWTGGTLNCMVDWNYVGNIFSDARVKNVVGTYDRGLAELRQLKPIRYRLKGNDRGVVPRRVPNRAAEQKRALAAPTIHDTEKVRVGIVAQEAEDILPELFLRAPVYIDGERADDVRTLDDGPWLLWAAINAIKELDARLARLEKHA